MIIKIFGAIAVIFLCIFFIPLSFGVAGGMFGIAAGFAGIVLGGIGAIVGGVTGIVAGAFGWIFDSPLNGFGIFDCNVFAVAAVVLFIALLIKRGRANRKHP